MTNIREKPRKVLRLHIWLILAYPCSFHPSPKSNLGRVLRDGDEKSTHVTLHVQAGNEWAVHKAGSCRAAQQALIGKDSSLLLKDPNVRVLIVMHLFS